MNRMVWVVATAILANQALSVEACYVPHEPPTAVRAAEAKAPYFGFIGTVITARAANEKSGSKVVRIAVTKDYSGQLPSEIDVLDPGCCVCVFISGKIGAEVISIVRKRDGDMYVLNY